MTNLDLDAIRAREAAATKGLWTTGADKEWSDALPPWALIIDASYPLTELQEGPQGVADAEFIARARKDVPALLAIAEDAQYDFGAMLCVEGECDHAETHDVACPLVEQRYATAEDVLELHRLRTLIERIKELTVSTDGDPVDNDEEIPVGEIVRVLAESESARAAL